MAKKLIFRTGKGKYNVYPMPKTDEQLKEALEDAKLWGWVRVDRIPKKRKSKKKLKKVM